MPMGRSAAAGDQAQRCFCMQVRACAGADTADHRVGRNLHFLLPYDASLDDMDAVGEVYSDVNIFAAVADM